MSRRVSRLRTEPPDRQPVLVAGALVIGLVFGLVMVPRLFSGMDSRSENYVLLASALYAQGESPMLLRDRLVSVGVQQPASIVLSLAQRYAQSRDRKQQQQAVTLEAFGKVLLTPETGASPTPRPTDIPPPSPTPTAVSTGVVTRLAGTPAVATASPAVANAAPDAPASPVAPVAGAAPAVSPVAVAPVSPTAAVAQRGRVRPADGSSARLRKDPNQTGPVLAIIPFAAQVEIQETVRGQVIEGESRWLRVRYGNLVGYLWSPLVTVGG